MIPGEVRVGSEPLELNAGRDHIELVAVNTGDRPIQIGSHVHLPNANPALQIDREAAEGFRLDVPSGTAVRFEPGVSRTLSLVRLAGRRYVPSTHVPSTHLPPTHLPSTHVPPTHLPSTHVGESAGQSAASRTTPPVAPIGGPGDGQDIP